MTAKSEIVRTSSKLSEDKMSKKVFEGLKESMLEAIAFAGGDKSKAKERQYPDISDILKRKARGRKQLAALSFGENIDILDAMRERVELIRRAREIRNRRP